MKDEWINNIARIHGVDCSLIVDEDGLVISKTGNASEKLAPLTTLLVKRLMEEIGLKSMDEWKLTLCETESVIIGISYVYIGVLVLVMRTDANLSLIGIEVDKLRQKLKDTFKGPFVTDTEIIHGNA